MRSSLISVGLTNLRENHYYLVTNIILFRSKVQKLGLQGTYINSFLKDKYQKSQIRSTEVTALKRNASKFFF